MNNSNLTRNTVPVRFVQVRSLGLMPSISLVAIVESYAAERLQLRWRSIQKAHSNFGYQRKRESNNA